MKAATGVWLLRCALAAACITVWAFENEFNEAIEFLWSFLKNSWVYQLSYVPCFDAEFSSAAITACN